MIISSLTKSASEGRTIDGLTGAISYGFLAFVVGLVISVILVIKVPEVKIKSIFYFIIAFLIIEIVVIVLGNLNSWWR
jgi:hypothetical protein